ncbi:MAG: ATP-binding protein [Halobacteriovoraceae bacterium]|nr:ATP-binding protein [Halobacteriovoraceae bacterium]
MKFDYLGKNYFLEDMVNSSPSCLKIINNDGKLLKMNQHGLNLIEADDFDSVAHADVYEIVHPEDRERFIKFNRNICSGEKGTLIFRLIGLKGTERWMESHAGPFELPDGKLGHIAITNDITEKVKLENEIRKREKVLEEASKLTALGEIAGEIAHEINNPLAIIYGNARQIKNMVKSDRFDLNQVKKNLQTIEETVERISKIIKGLKMISRNEKKEIFSESSLLEIVDSTLSICIEKFKSRNVSLDVEVDEDCQLSCNPVQISQVLLNLLNNAFDALETNPNPKIKIIGKNHEDKVLLKVSDNGEPIPKEIREKIMEPFFTTKETGKGTGLGLSISHSIIATHGGEIYLEEDTDQTEFVISLPRG